jgi:hypothetical protein
LLVPSCLPWLNENVYWWMLITWLLQLCHQEEGWDWACCQGEPLRWMCIWGSSCVGWRDFEPCSCLPDDI